jgi:hypothetical protein
MSMLAFFAIAAMAGAVFALACGVAAMVSNGEVLHHRSEEWMGWRVVWQGIALLLVAMLLATAAYGAAPARAECVYDYALLTSQECRAYRARVLKATSDEERVALHTSVQEVMDARALERGISSDDWRGLAVAPLARAGGTPSTADIAASLAFLVAIGAVALLVMRSLRPLRGSRLMRCPETGGIAYVQAEPVAHGQWVTPVVRSCDLWPARKDCARGCLARYAEADRGLFFNVNALRPFEHR